MAGAVDAFTLPTLTIKPRAGSRLLRQEIKAMRFREPSR
jgi:hypothetical protein